MVIFAIAKFATPCYTSGSGKEVNSLKTNIHPKYQPAKVTCACGYTFETGSTITDIKTEICSQCHPFYTGKQRAVMARGRVEQFKSRYGLE